MQRYDRIPISEDSQTNTKQSPGSDSGLNSIHPHTLIIASLLLSAYEEFLEKRQARLDATRNPRYNQDKNICAGGRDGELD